MRVLVVEDAPKMADLLRRGLAEEGYAVDVAMTGTMGSGWRPSAPSTRSSSTSSCPTSTGSRSAAGSAWPIDGRRC